MDTPLYGLFMLTRSVGLIGFVKAKLQALGHQNTWQLSLAKPGIKGVSCLPDILDLFY